MRQVANLFRGIPSCGDVEPMGGWLSEVINSGIHGMQQFCSAFLQDLATAVIALREPWSSGPNGWLSILLKSLKRSMYSLARLELPRARMLR